MLERALLQLQLDLAAPTARSPPTPRLDPLERNGRARLQDRHRGLRSNSESECFARASLSCHERRAGDAHPWETRTKARMRWSWLEQKGAGVGAPKADTLHLTTEM